MGDVIRYVANWTRTLPSNQHLEWLAAIAADFGRHLISPDKEVYGNWTMAFEGQVIVKCFAYQKARLVEADQMLRGVKNGLLVP